MRRWMLLALAGVVLPVWPAAGQSRRDAESKARVLGQLTATRLDVDVRGATARETFRALARAVGVPIMGRYIDERFDFGIDPELPLELAVSDRDALDVLEMLVEQCELYAPCTWQIRKGSVEVGTKDRLGTPAAAETRVYHLKDMTIQAPYFEAPPLSELLGTAAPLPAMVSSRRHGLGTVRGRSVPAYFARHDYATAALSIPDPTGRKKPEQLVEEIVWGIVEIIEPGNWDYDQFDERPVEPEGRGRRTGRRAGPRTDLMARLRILESDLIIDAPDFIHRQIDGYPTPIPPPPLTDEERERRSAEASASEHITIRVLPSTGRATAGTWR